MNPWYLPKLVLISTAEIAQAPGQLPNTQLLGQRKGIKLQHFWQLTSAIVAITWHLSEFEKKRKKLMWPSCQFKKIPTPLPKAKPTDLVIRYHEAVF